MFNSKSNRDIMKDLDKYVVGHTRAKKSLITMLNRSKLAYYQKHLDITYDGDAMETSNCLLIGSSGTGKTYLVESLQKVVDFPLIRVDATRFSPSGSGQKFTPESLNKMILLNAKKLVDDPKSTYFSLEGAIDQTVVFIDEIDKLARSYGSSDGWHTQIQASLLSMIENQQALRSVSYIFAGAFSEMEFDDPTPLGFNAQHTEEKTIADVSDADVIEYGLIPELVGRIAAIDVLDTLTFDLMSDILMNKLLPIKNRDLCYMGCPLLVLTEADIEEVVNTALDSGQGVRALKREVNNLSLEREFNYEDKLCISQQ